MIAIIQKLNEAYELITAKQQELLDKENVLNGREENLNARSLQLDERNKNLITLEEKIVPIADLQKFKADSDRRYKESVNLEEKTKLEREKFESWLREQKLIIEGERVINANESKRLKEKEETLEKDIRARVKRALENAGLK